MRAKDVISSILAIINNPGSKAHPGPYDVSDVLKTRFAYSWRAIKEELSRRSTKYKVRDLISSDNPQPQELNRSNRELYEKYYSESSDLEKSFWASSSEIGQKSSSATTAINLPVPQHSTNVEFSSVGGTGSTEITTPSEPTFQSLPIGASSGLVQRSNQSFSPSRNSILGTAIDNSSLLPLFSVNYSSENLNFGLNISKYSLSKRHSLAIIL